MPFTFVYVDDVVNALVCAAESAVEGETFFVGHRTPETTGALLRAMASALGRTYRPFSLPPALVRLGAVIGDAAWQAGLRPLLDSSRLAEFTAPGFVCDVDRARQRLGFTADVPLADGVARTVRWYRERGWV